MQYSLIISFLAVSVMSIPVPGFFDALFKPFVLSAQSATKSTSFSAADFTRDVTRPVFVHEISQDTSALSQSVIKAAASNLENLKKF